MRSLIPLLLLIAALYSCKKDRFNAAEIRLLKAERVDSSGGIHNKVFEFDQAGRITRVSGTASNGSPVGGYTITYSGNEVTIYDEAYSSPPLYHKERLTYQLNNDHQPVLRVTYDSFSLTSPLQRTIKIDTARYEYDAAGLIKKVTGTTIDSTWVNPGIIQTSTIRGNYTRDYTNSNGKLTSITTLIQEFTTYRRLSILHTGSSTTEATHTFEYIRNEPNKTDFVNAWLLAELGILYGKEYPLGKSYLYYPEKVSYTKVSKDGNGQITYTDSYSRSVTLDHNKYGFISSITPVGSPYDKVELIYNR